MSQLIKVGLVLDVETTGLSPNTDEMVEVALKLFTFNENTGEIIDILDEDSYLREPMSESARRNYDKAYEVHGISFESVQGKSFHDEKVRGYFARTDAVFAHNASFDRSFLLRMYPEVNDLHWFCTMRGVKWKDYGNLNSKLLTLLKSHSITNFQSHRAMDDITYLLELLKKTNPYGDFYLHEVLKRGPMRKYKPAAKQVKRKSAFSSY